MADINLTQQDIDYIARVVDTEVPRSIKRTNPAEYERMVKAVTDTVTNRMASGQFPSTATGVLNQRRQFSKITGPQRLGPYGSVQNTPKAPADLQNMVAGHIADRLQGEPSIVEGSVNYANPNFSSPNNLGWINSMIDAGAEKFGIGRSVHYHGNAPGMQEAGLYTMDAEGIPYGDIPTPTPRGVSPSEYGMLSVIDPPTVTPVERRSLPAVTQQPQFNQSRFASGAPVGIGQLSGALSQQAAGLDGMQKPDASIQAPPTPSIPASVLADQYKQYGVGQAALRNATLPVSIDATTVNPPVVSPPRPVVAAPAPIVSAPQVSRPAPSMAPPVSFSGQDVWSGRSNTGIATNGNQLTRNPDGSISRVSNYGYTETMNPDGSFRSTTAPGLFGLDAAANRAFGSFGRNPQQPGLNLGSRAKTVAGSAAGAMVGGAVLGPIGALLGGYLGKRTVQGKSPLGGLFGIGSPQRTVQGGFTNGLSFPSQPNGPSYTGDGQLTQFGREAARGDHGGRNSQAGRAARGEISGLF